LPVAMVSLGFVFYGDLRAEPGVKLGFTLVWIAGILFAANVLVNLRRSEAGASQRAGEMKVA